MRAQLEDRLRRLGIEGDTATALGFALVAVAAVAVAIVAMIATHIS